MRKKTNLTQNPPSAFADDITFNHARIEPTHCLTDGLFRPFQNGTRDETPLDVSHTYKHTHTFRWQHPTECLSINDQDLFVAILRIASHAGNVTEIAQDTTDLAMKSARDALQLELDASNYGCLAIRTGLRDLAKRIGIAISGPALTRLDASMERLANVTLTISQSESDNPIWRSRMFGVLKTEGSKRLIAINPWLSRAVQNEPVTYIDIDEQRALTMDVARRLHFWISGWANPGKTTQPTSLTRFLPHVWGPGAVNDPDNYRMRTLIKAFGEIEQKTLWKCRIQKTEDGSFVRITRPQLGTKPVPSKAAA